MEESLRRASSNIRYSEGRITGVIKVEKIIPPMTTSDIGAHKLDSSVRLKANGRSPRMEVNEVMAIGRTRL